MKFNTLAIFLMFFLLVPFACGKKPDAPAAPTTEKPLAVTPAKTMPEKTALKTTDAKLEAPATILKKELGEWKMVTAPRYFGPDNLYDLINGGSEVFVSYGFSKLATVDYRSEDTTQVSITTEVYNMGSALGAFGRVSRYLENLVDPSNAGRGMDATMEKQSILGDGDLVFWKGQYIVHLTLMDESPEATVEKISALSKQHLPMIGKSIFDNINIPAGTMLTEPSLPTQDMIGRSTVWHPENLMGFEALPSGYAARYKKDSSQWTVFVSDALASDKAAAGAVKELDTPKPAFAKVVGNRIVGILNNGDGDLSPMLLDDAISSIFKTQ